MPLSKETIRSSQQLVIETFTSFRDELMRGYGTIEHLAKDDGSPVTELDVKVETVLRARLLAAYPEIGFHGEETGDSEGDSGALWIVDPIDGTKSYMHGLPYCSNMTALVVDGVIEAAVIYHFATDELFTALRGEGAYCNGTRLSVKNTQLSDSIVFVSSFPYKNFYHLFEPHNMGIYAPLGASSYEYTRLAQGSIQGVTKLNCKSMMHDNVPGVLLAQGAGAQIVPFEADEYHYEMLNFVIGTPNVTQLFKSHHDEIKLAVQAPSLAR